MKPYIYIVKNKQNGKFYIGSQCSGKIIGINYFTSSTDKEFKEDFKNNPQNYIVEIIKEFDDSKECILEENKLIKENFENPLILNKKYYLKGIHSRLKYVTETEKKIYKEKRKKEYMEYRERNKEEINKKNSIYMKKYNKEHKDEISKKKKEYYIKNKEKFLAKAKEYSLAHKTERNLKNKIERFIKKIGKFEEYKNLTTKEKIIFREKIILEYN